MQELFQCDLEKAVQRLPKDLKYHLGNFKKFFVIAGGYLRATIAGERVKDIDIFVASKIDAEELVNKLQPDRAKQHVTDNAYSITVNGRSVQIIHKWTFYDPEKVLKAFDYTIAKAAIWLENKEWYSMCDDFYYQHLAGKRLVYNTPEEPEPGSSIKRMLKFVKLGYSIDARSLAELLSTFCNETIGSNILPNDLEKELETESY